MNFVNSKKKEGEAEIAHVISRTNQCFAKFIVIINFNFQDFMLDLLSNFREQELQG